MPRRGAGRRRRRSAPAPSAACCADATDPAAASASRLPQTCVRSKLVAVAAHVDAATHADDALRGVEVEVRRARCGRGGAGIP